MFNSRQLIILIITISETIFPAQSINDWSLSTMVSVQKNGRHICTGVLITNSVVLTTRHCLIGITSASILSVQPNFDGQIYSPTDPKSESAQVLDFVVHPETRISNDIGLIQLNSYIKTLNSTGRTIKIMGKDEQLTGDETLILVSWGYTKSLVVEGELSLTAVDLVDQSECTKRFEIPDNQVDQLICGRPYRSEICRGDAGSPVFVIDPTKHTVKVISLLVYSTIKCSSDLFLSVRVSNSQDWIDKSLTKFHVTVELAKLLEKFANSLISKLKRKS